MQPEIFMADTESTRATNGETAQSAEDTSNIETTEKPKNDFKTQVVLKVGEQTNRTVAVPFKSKTRTTFTDKEFTEDKIITILKQQF